MSGSDAKRLVHAPPPGPGSARLPPDADLAMARYPALIDGEKGAYGVTLPDLPGIVAMGASVDEVLVNAEEALRDYVIEAGEAGDAITPPTPMERVTTPTGFTLVSVPFIRVSSRRVLASEG